jgi:acyl carrier protein
MTARLDVRDQLRFEKQGMDGVTPEHGMKALQQILEEPSVAQAALLSIRWDVYARTTTSSFFSGLASEHRVRSTKESDQGSSFLQEYNKLPAARQQQMLRSFLSEQARLILGLDATESIDVNQSLRELGLDSLIAVELRNLLSASLKADLSATLLFDYPTITNLANYLFKEVLQKSHPTPGDMAGETHKKSTGSSPAPASTQINVQELSDEEAEALLLAELDDKDTKGAKK